ncbi:MAG TPA: class I adenylate-forming enzyme family protein [Burkholderiaceae bacterium]|nr:class I adenylate-forming enzyme family protein [Burkholderiaceae bacterium]
MSHFVSPDWGVLWPPMRQEAHYGDRVVACFAGRPATLHQMLDEAVQRNPDGDALVCGAERLTYRQLWAQSARVAAGFAARGVKAGDRVALLLGNRIEFVLALFAAARLGAITVPISVREQTPGLAYMLEHCAAVLLVHEAELAALLPPPAQLPALRSRIAAGGACADSEPFDALLAHGAGPEPAPVGEEDTAAILYTSGTTGRPKGAMLTHLGVVHSSMHYQIAMGLGPDDSSIAAVPLSHVTGLVALITTMVRAAGKLVIMPAFKAADFLRLAARERMTHTLMVPAMYNLCLLQSDFAAHDLTRWRIGAFGGAPMPLAPIETLARTVPSLTLMNCYGATETTSPTTLMPAGCNAAHGDTVGTTLGCAEVCVMDDAGREVPRGQTGEIWIRGPMVVPGYWNNPEATSANLTGGFWHSGDIGSQDEQGYVRVVDRMKDMINRGGYKIYTIEVENALYAHPAVQECAVIAKPCPVLGERVHAFVALKAAGTTAEELRDFVKPRLSDYKVPETFTISTTPLPRNANGKLMKRAMRDELLASLESPR